MTSCTPFHRPAMVCLAIRKPPSCATASPKSIAPWRSISVGLTLFARRSSGCVGLPIVDTSRPTRRRRQHPQYQATRFARR